MNNNPLDGTIAELDRQISKLQTARNAIAAIRGNSKGFLEKPEVYKAKPLRKKASKNSSKRNTHKGIREAVMIAVSAASGDISLRVLKKNLYKLGIRKMNPGAFHEWLRVLMKEGIIERIKIGVYRKMTNKEAPHDN